MPTPGQIAAALRRFRLVTVNPQPERARNVVGRVIPLLEGRFKVEHVGNIKGAALILRCKHPGGG